MLWRGVAVSVVTAVVLAGCGDSDSPLSPGGGETFSQTISGSVAVFSESRHALPITVSGDLTLRLTWSDPSVDLDLYLTQSSCTVSLYPLGECGVILASIASTGSAETITRPVSSGEQFQVWIDNLSTTQAMNYTLTIDID
jgi:hypothetical protein